MIVYSRKYSDYRTFPFLNSRDVIEGLFIFSCILLYAYDINEYLFNYNTIGTTSVMKPINLILVPYTRHSNI